MVIKNSSPTAIATELGERLKTTRLNANISQDKLAKMIGMSVKSVKNAEKGKCQFETMVAILMALGKADQLDLLLPVSNISPIQLAKLQGKQRQRATNSASSSKEAGKVKPAW
jgi:putative transcriptional regulator